MKHLKNEQTNSTRRHLLKVLAATGGAALATSIPATWTKPVIDVGWLPVHAQASPQQTDIQETLCPGEPYDSQITTFIPAVPNKADILFAFDTTASMGPVLNRAKSEAAKILTQISALIPNARFGVIDFRDYAIFSPNPEDYPYQLRQPITNDTNLVIQAINNLNLGGGGDLPEAYTRALFESYQDKNIGFRNEARRFVIMFGDAVPHDDNFNEGLANPPFNPGGEYCELATCTLDPGRDETLGTADDLDIQTVLADVAASQISLLFIQSSADPEQLVYWNYWAGLTGSGGQAVLLGNVDNLADVIINLIGEASREINRLTLEVVPHTFTAWLISAEEAIDLTIPQGGSTIDLVFTLTPPLDTKVDIYSFTLRTVGDSVVYGETSVQITIPENC